MLTKQQIEDLFEANVLEINKMSLKAGTMIKSVINNMERQVPPAYIRLKAAAVGGQTIGFEHVEGDTTLVERVANSLGVICGQGTLEVKSKT